MKALLTVTPRGRHKRQKLSYLSGLGNEAANLAFFFQILSGKVEPKSGNEGFLTNSCNSKPQTEQCYSFNQVNIYASF